MAYPRVCALAALLTLAVVGCGPTQSHGGGGNSGGGGGAGGSGGSAVGGGGGSGGGGSSELMLIIRVFNFDVSGDPTTNPDFENVPKADANGNPSSTYMGPWPDPNIVAATIGADHTPVYKNASGGTLTTHGATAFGQWYHDVAGTNIRKIFPLPLTQYPDGTSGYDSSKSGVPYGPGSPDLMFFPIDDGTPYATTFGDEGDPHNYSFTAEAHTTFTYNGGETFHYRGDDDVFVFINGQLVINLGGIHDPETGDVQLDSLGLHKGQTYPLDFFFAERHKGGSNVLFTTTLVLTQVPIS